MGIRKRISAEGFLDKGGALLIYFTINHYYLVSLKLQNNHKANDIALSFL